MALVTYHACDRCGEKRDKAHHEVAVLVSVPKPEKDQPVLAQTMFGGAVVRRTIELCEKCSAALAEITDKFLKP